MHYLNTALPSSISKEHDNMRPGSCPTLYPKQGGAVALWNVCGPAHASTVAFVATSLRSIAKMVLAKRCGTRTFSGRKSPIEIVRAASIKRHFKSELLTNHYSPTTREELGHPPALWMTPITLSL